MYQILERYLQINQNIYGVEELLNPFYSKYWERNGRIFWEQRANNPDSIEYRKVFDERLELAKNHHGKIFFKVFPSAFRPEAFNWLLDSFHFVTHERENLYEQVLSNLLSYATNHWYSEEGLNVSTGSVTANFQDFKYFEKSYLHFIQLKKYVRPIASFTYEDFTAKSPTSLLREAGFNGPFTEEGLSLFKKQSPDNKKELFKNQNEVLRWYENSLFQRLHPI